MNNIQLIIELSNEIIFNMNVVVMYRYFVIIPESLILQQYVICYECVEA